MNGFSKPPVGGFLTGNSTPEQVRRFHEKDDVDFKRDAHHHTIGYGANQAASGQEFFNLLVNLELNYNKNARATLLGKFHGILASSRTRAVNVMFLGSSTTQGVGASSESERWVNMFASAIQNVYRSGAFDWEPGTVLTADAKAPDTLLPGVHAINAGVGGTVASNYVSAGLLTTIGTVKPLIFFHMIGSNNMFFGNSPESVKNSVNSTINDINAAVGGLVTPVHVICNTFERGDIANPAYPWSAYAQAFRSLVKGRTDCLIADPQGQFVQSGCAGYTSTDPLGLYAPDRVHASDRGHQLLAHSVAEDLAIPVPRLQRNRSEWDFHRRITFAAGEDLYNWTGQSGMWFSPDGYKMAINMTGGNVVYNPGYGDSEFTAIMRMAMVVNPGIFVKSANATDRLAFILNGVNDRAELYKGTTLLNFGLALGLTNQEYLLKTSVKGDQFKGFLNNKLVISHTLSPADVATYSGAAYTRHGCRCGTYNADVYWRNMASRKL